MEVFTDSLWDTVKVFPFIVLIYVLIEFLERRTSFTKNHELLQGRLAPLIGTVTGIVPQCGFSVMAAKLYDKGYIRTGTLLAVFLATSDEALIILLINPSGAAAVVPLIAVKVAAGLAVGYAVNFLLRDEKLAVPAVAEGEDIHACSCGREHDGGKLKVYLIDPLVHSLKIALYIFVVTLIFGYIFEFNESAILSSFVGGPYVEPLITAAIGLIPNCAASAVIAQAYCEGGICFGSMVAGLCCNAGLGFVVLLRNTKKLKRNMLLIVTLYAVSVLAGLAVNGIMAAANIL